MIELEFIKRRRIPWPAAIFCCLALTALVAATVQWYGLNRTSQQLQGRIDRAERALAAKHRSAIASQVPDPGATQRRKEEDQIITQLRYPWNRVLFPIEQASIDDVTLMSLTHDASGDGTQLTVTAVDAAALNRYVDKLNGDGDEHQWYLSSYQIDSSETHPAVRGNIAER